MIAEDRSEVDLLKDTGYSLRQLFRNREAADTWVANVDFNLQEPTRATTGTRRHATRVGPDPSTSPTEVFGVNIDNIEEMDRVLLPGGTGPKDADDMYDCAADVMALPGGYKNSTNEDDDEQGDVAKALMTIATGRRETGIHMRYNARNQNGIRQIKSADDLSEFIENVHEAWHYAKSTMHSQFTRRMYRAGAGTPNIDDYLQNGVLIRVCHDTYTGYAYFLTTLAGYVSKMKPGEDWKTSVAGNLLKIHEGELARIRATSASYRELLLRNYAYIREQAKTNFWNNKLSKKMALVTTQAMSLLQPPSTSGGGGGTVSATNRNYCDICRRVHQGRPCAAAIFSTANRARLGAGLAQRKYEKALRFCKDAFAANSNANHDTVIEGARQAAQT